jgi:uncharacterized protein (DUF952 family)
LSTKAFVGQTFVVVAAVALGLRHRREPAELHRDLTFAVSDLVVHIARQSEWESGLESGSYVPAEFAGEGFIHMSTPEQAHLPANALFSRRDGLVLLWIDPARLTSELRYERAELGDEEFPHLFGPLDPAAVIGVTPLEPWEPGAFALPPPPR